MQTVQHFPNFINDNDRHVYNILCNHLEENTEDVLMSSKLDNYHILVKGLLTIINHKYKTEYDSCLIDKKKTKEKLLINNHHGSVAVVILGDKVKIWCKDESCKYILRTKNLSVISAEYVSKYYYNIFGDSIILKFYKSCQHQEVDGEK